MIMYYYIYYLLSIFAKKFNNRDGDYAFTAIFYYAILIGLNISTILIIISGEMQVKLQVNLQIFISIIIPSVIHYLGLVRNKKYIDVIKIYDETFENTLKSKNKTILFLIYLIGTFFFVIYVAIIARAQNL